MGRPPRGYATYLTAICLASCTRLKAESNAQKYRHEELLMSSERSAAMQRTILTCSEKLITFLMCGSTLRLMYSSGRTER